MLYPCDDPCYDQCYDPCYDPCYSPCRARAVRVRCACHVRAMCVHAMCMPCARRARAMDVPCACHARAMRVPCARRARAIACHVHAVRVPCACLQHVASRHGERPHRRAEQTSRSSGGASPRLLLRPQLQQQRHSGRVLLRAPLVSLLGRVCSVSVQRTSTCGAVHAAHATHAVLTSLLSRV